MKAKCGLVLLAICFAAHCITPGSAYPSNTLNDRTNILEALINKLQQASTQEELEFQGEEEMEIQGPEPKAYENGI